MRRPVSGYTFPCGLLLSVLAGVSVAGGQSTPPFERGPISERGPVSGRGDVSIPVVDYRALLEAADAAGVAAPALAKTDSARFRVVLDDDSADFEETFGVRVSGSGWISLPIVRAALDRATVSPAEHGAFFVARDVTRLALLGPGVETVTLGTKVRLSTDPNGRRFFSFTMPLLAVQQGRIDLPGVRLEVSVTGGELLSRSEGKGATALEIAVRPGAVLSVSFREQNLAEKGVSATLKASATLYSRSDVVGPNLVTDVAARITATSGRIPGIAFEIPAGYKVLFLRGPGLLAAETVDGQVRASRVSPSPDPLQAELRLTRPLEEGAPVELPAPRLVLDGPVDTFVELRPPAGVLVEMVSPGGFEPIELDKLPPEWRTLAAEAEEILHLPAKPGRAVSTAAATVAAAVYRLHRLDAAPVLAAQVRLARGQTVVAPGGRSLSRIEYEVVSSAKPFLTVRLTPGSTFWGAEAMGRPILPAMPETGSIAIPLRAGRRRVARVAIYVLASSSLPRGKGTYEFQPPGTDIPISTLSWSFSFPPGAEYKLAGADYRTGPAAGGGFEPAAASDQRTELGQRAQVALAREAQAAGRAPIVPRMPEPDLVVTARTQLPGSTPKPIRFDVKPTSAREEWQ